jgi:hypothetical protein
MSYLDAIPALVKVGAAFGLILFLNRLRLSLGWALLAGSAFLGLLMGLGPSALWDAAAESLFDPSIAALLLIVAVILALSRIMSEGGQLERMVDSFTRMTGDSRVAAMVMPALIGLLPMPGGALFSAPMVDSACRAEPVEAELKTAVNYWFRHIWEYWWPLYPGVVLAVGLLKVEAWRFMLIQAPLTLLSLAGGMIFLLPRMPRNRAQAGRRAEGYGGWWAFAREALPIALVILALPAVWLFERISGVETPGLAGIFLGLGLCLAWVLFQNRPTPGRVASAFFSRSTAGLILLICAVMVFKGVLTGSGAVAGIQSELVRYGIPPLAVLMCVPFLAGLITGIAVGFVGASFPLVVGLIAGKSGLDFLAHASLAYAFGYMGMMLSPVHVCFLVTKDYFGSPLSAAYRRVVGPAVLVLAGAVSYFIVLVLVS